MNELTSFFSEVTTKKDSDDKVLRIFNNILYLCCKDFGWNQEDTLNADIPFVLGLVDTQIKINKEHEASMKKGRKK